MSKTEFLNTLRISLNGKISPEQVEDHLTYYRDYIDTRIRTGQEEEEILGSLGDPRLIARSIVEAEGRDGAVRENRESGYSSSSGTGEKEYRRTKQFRIPVWLWIFLVVFLIVLILGCFFSIVWSLLPVLIPVALVIVLIRVIKRNR